MKGLLIAGGQSSRMKQEKASLVFNGMPLHAKLTQLLKTVTDSVYISARRDSNFLAVAQASVFFDEIDNIGPASALLRAAREFPEHSWLVTACDFPLLEPGTLQTLLEVHTSFNSRPEITCYVHEDGTPEPLLAIWTPTALRRLENNVAAGLQGPMATLKQSQVQLVKPSDPHWLLNINTPEDWERANAVE